MSRPVRLRRSADAVKRARWADGQAQQHLVIAGALMLAAPPNRGAAVYHAGLALLRLAQGDLSGEGYKVARSMVRAIGGEGT